MRALLKVLHCLLTVFCRLMHVHVSEGSMHDGADSTVDGADHDKDTD